MSDLEEAIAEAISSACWAESSEFTPGGCGCDEFPCAQDVAGLATERVLAVLEEHTTEERRQEMTHTGNGWVPAGIQIV